MGFFGQDSFLLLKTKVNIFTRKKKKKKSMTAGRRIPLRNTDLFSDEPLNVHGRKVCVLLVADPFDGVQFKNAGASGGRCRS